MECKYDFDEPHCKKKKTRVATKKLEWHLIVYVPIKRWQTDERAEMEQDKIWIELIEEEK